MPGRATVFILASLLGIGLGAHAQTQGSGVRESTDPAKVAAVERAAKELMARQTAGGGSAAPATIVAGQTASGYRFLSGGISIGDRTRMHAQRGGYSLWVATVAKPSGAYLSDVRLRVVSLRDGKTVVDRTMVGPWFFVDLPAGRYDISATMPPDGPDAAQTLNTRVAVPKAGQRQTVLRFASSAEVSPQMASPFGGNPFGRPTDAH